MKRIRHHTMPCGMKQAKKGVEISNDGLEISRDVNQNLHDENSPLLQKLQMDFGSFDLKIKKQARLRSKAPFCLERNVLEKYETPTCASGE